MAIEKKILIIVTGITTLDEARYFAAMGTDWIGFDAQQLSAGDMKTIADWVVGPKMFIEMDVIQEDLLFEISNKIQLHGICLPPDQEVPAWYSGRIIRSFSLPTPKETLKELNPDILLLRLEMSIEESDFDTLHHLCTHYTCWIETDPMHISFEELFETLPLSGIVIRCKGEAKGHSDAYIQYDAFFEESEKWREI